MGGLEFPEKRALADKLSDLATGNKSFTRTPAEAEHYEAGYRDGQDAGFAECLQIAQDLIDNAVPGTNRMTVAGMVYLRDEIAQQGAIDLEEAA